MKKQLTRLRSWSYSTWKAYKQCPRKIKFKKLDGTKEPSSPAMDRGTAIHEEAEIFVRDNLKVLPESLKLFKAQFAKLLKVGAVPEMEIALNDKWEVVSYDSKQAWFRAKIDVHYKKVGRKKQVIIKIIDYKTGKVYPDNIKQLSLYALVIFILIPEADLVEGELWYIDQGPEATQKDSFTRAEFGDMLEAWQYEANKLMNDTIFAPRPGWYCRFCHFSKFKDGPCEF